jgi:hypothetical protein
VKSVLPRGRGDCCHNESQLCGDIFERFFSSCSGVQRACHSDLPSLSAGNDSQRQPSFSFSRRPLMSLGLHLVANTR